MKVQLIPPPDPDIYFDIPFDVYNSWHAMRQSSIKSLSKSPAHYQAFLRKGVHSSALRTGSLTDDMIFTPDVLDDRYVMTPGTYVADRGKDKGQTKPWNGNAIACKEWLDEQDDGKIIVTQAEYNEAVNLSGSVRRHHAASEILGDGKSQVCIVWVDEETGITCKARLDWLDDKGILDLKTTIDASPEGFPKQIENFKYHVQGAMYSDAIAAITGRTKTFRILAVEKKDPWPVAVYELGQSSLEAGRSIYKRALFNYRACCENEEWPGYSRFVEPINIPIWALREELGKDFEDDTAGW